jgi:hypothetical protein
MEAVPGCQSLLLMESEASCPAQMAVEFTSGLRAVAKVSAGDVGAGGAMENTTLIEQYHC